MVNGKKLTAKLNTDFRINNEKTNIFSTNHSFFPDGTNCNGKTTLRDHLPDGTFRNPEGSQVRANDVKFSYRYI